MKLGSKKTKQSELLDAMGSEAVMPDELSAPSTPAPSHTPEPVVAKATSTLPVVEAERFVFSPLSFEA